MRRWIPIILLIVGVVFYLRWRGDEQQILRQLDRLEELMSKPGTEDQLAAFGRAREVSALFIDGFVARAEPWQGTLTDRKELTGALIRYRSAARVIEARIGSRRVEVNRDLGLATLIGDSEVVMDFGGRTGGERRRVRIEWVKEDGSWWIREVELLESLGEGLLW